MIFLHRKIFKGGIVFVHKVKDFEVIFDSEKEYDLVTILKGRKTKRRKIYIDESIKNKPYAKVSFQGECIKIHHILSGCPLNKRMTDHFNGNSLDNRRENLRTVTRSENGYNKPSRTNHRWITKQKNGKYQVCFRIGLGTFLTLEEAQNRVRTFLKENKIEIYKDFYE